MKFHFKISPKSRLMSFLTSCLVGEYAKQNHLTRSSLLNKRPEFATSVSTRQHCRSRERKSWRLTSWRNTYGRCWPTWIRTWKYAIGHRPPRVLRKNGTCSFESWVTFLCLFCLFLLFVLELFFRKNGLPETMSEWGPSTSHKMSGSGSIRAIYIYIYKAHDHHVPELWNSLWPKCFRRLSENDTTCIEKLDNLHVATR